MAYQSLANLYRPKIFDHIIGQPHIVRILKNSVTNKKVANAYLFTGTRGIGKTTAARVLAKAINCKNPTDGNPCLECVSCKEISPMDIIEIDGASNNGVDQIRDIVDSTPYLPSSGNFRVYIIDEVHMVTVNGFNALLKTLEEPPSHVLFIMATTNPQKIPDTIISRCQVLNFQEVDTATLESYLSKVTSDLKIKIEGTTALNRIAKSARGSVRDCLTILDQVLTFDDSLISDDSVSRAVGLVKLSLVEELFGYLLKGDVYNLSKLYRGLISENIDINNLVLELSNFIYEIIQTKLNVNKKDIAPEFLEYELSEYIFILENLTKDFAWISNSILPDRLLEILLQKLAIRKNYLRHQVNKNKEELKDLGPKKVDDKKEAAPLAEEVKETKESNITFETFLKQNAHLRLAMSLEQKSKLEEDNDNIKIYFPYAATPFFEQLDKDKDKLEQLYSDFYKKKVNIKLILENIEVKNDILENHMILKAKNLFNSQVDKVNINN